ncbi:hypothetical protein B0T16DRAFT_394616 [Cercophora newfieldiana]|uniref:Uncharacterized protein n=1 Tax=Cercophora newfieldiana TaxID=92897 RepID=A0AA39XR98_9PEZI|nr:hypothetical protein B0T16DRAFT_394616 [Cercophora newfieldiana]
MTASAEQRPMLPDSGAPQGDYVLGGQPRMFKKHKVLPHPKREVYPGATAQDVRRSTPRIYGLDVDTLLSQQSSSSQDSSPSLRRRPKRIASGPEPPPTPPTHSRKSSSSRSVNNPSSPTTPPGPVARHAKPRPLISDRIPSKVTVDSRTESFKTAPENPLSSEDEDDGRSTLRPLPPSAKTSQSTVRLINGEKKAAPRAVGLGLGLESSPGGEITPRTAKEFNVFDGEWVNGAGGSGSEVEEEWDDNLQRNVTVKKRRPAPQVNGHKEVIEDLTVTPTNATKALRSMSLQESPIVYPARRVVSDRFPVIQAAPSHSQSSISSDLRRSSIMSTKSTTSTIVEAILVEHAPQRRKTLRHVRKQMGLRDSRSDLSPTSSAATSISAYIDNAPRQRPSDQKVTEVAREIPRQSVVSNGTVNTISSRKARREVRKNGGIPVVIVPERKSSVKSSSKEPSLRSTSSRRSKRSQSLTSAQVSQVSRSRDLVTLTDRPSRRSRTMSESDGSRPGDQRTMDFPPTIPTRSSSLSAPTSRNASRTGSLTAESLRAHNAFQAQQGLHRVDLVLEKLDVRKPNPEQDSKVVKQDEITVRDAPMARPAAPAEMLRPEILIRRATSLRSKKSEEARHSTTYPESHGTHEDEHRLHVDRYGDPFFGRRLSVQNTPFSQGSVDTAGTSHAEVSEALAVNIYPHQNTSVLVVDHSNKPSESSSPERRESSEPETPRIGASDAEEKIPVTPPQAMSMDDVDSPLRNPRAPPEPPSMPPAINFIPATPSGLTPAVEKQKQLGNFYELEDTPKRRPSLLQRTLSRGRTRRTSEYGPSPARPVGLLKRTFSLSRSRKSQWDDGDRPGLRRHSFADDRPADETRLHPFWRPAYADDESASESEDDWAEETSGGRTYRYPRIDNRPWQPRRSLSARMKKTFAILPVRDDYEYEARDADRRTIRRTPSGNLRVMKFRKSLESMPRLPVNDGRPYTAPGDSTLRSRQFRFWRSPKSSADSFRRSGLLPALGSKINIPRRMSERRREKRTQELRRMISSPREVRDGVGDVIRRNSYREAFERQ